MPFDVTGLNECPRKVGTDPGVFCRHACPTAYLCIGLLIEALSSLFESHRHDIRVP